MRGCRYCPGRNGAEAATVRCRLCLRRWRAKLVQNPFAQQIGIALAGFRKLYDPVGDHCDGGVVSIRKAKGSPGHFECDAHNARGLGIKFEAV